MYRRQRFYFEEVESDKPHQFGVYDPRFDVISQYCGDQSWSTAKSIAERVARDDPEAGFVAFEILKHHALEAGVSYRASEAADGAARAMKQLRSGR